MSRRLTQAEFISRSCAAHGDKYDYSKAVYNGAFNKVIITCPVHGDFDQEPANHLSGRGCPQCAHVRPMMQQAEFISKASIVHDHKYAYDRAVYRGASSKVLVTCPIHGDFLQTASEHLSGRGCPKCGHNRSRMTLDEFVSRARKVHVGKYIYDGTVYNGWKNELTILCPKHGSFHQTPRKHLSGVGCPQCVMDQLNETLRGFIARASVVHNNRYTYEKAIYVGADHKLTITCPIHGEFQQTPSTHLRGSGCPKCARNQLMTTAEFISKASIVHNGFYTYEHVKYETREEKVFVTCPIHGEFLQRASAHLSGCGCPKCIRKVSVGETQLADWIESLGYKVIRNSRSIISPKELDLWMPDQKVAIEYCGEYWHSLSGMSESHLWKRSRCAELGIRLLFLSDHDWMSGEGKQIVLNWMDSSEQYAGIDDQGNLL